jgi:hypothetical protein
VPGSWATEWPAEINSPPSARPLLILGSISWPRRSPRCWTNRPATEVDAAIQLREIEIERARLLAGEPDGAVDRSGFHFIVKPDDADEWP